MCLLSSFCKSKSRTDHGSSVDIFSAMNQMLSLSSTKNMEPNCPTGLIRYQPLGSLVLVTYVKTGRAISILRVLLSSVVVIKI